ncbi:hypothetical protein MNVI_17410 [Mycobacterium noviomagense]|uniref:Uncharacterized protein n=1 Tax=Mycobacterium noviomagense TaxID=459858 RepID=A0A7I7PCT7_9MYCO|nr:hypothetical protein BST37_12425 [Mycobacterium noviomagense]BBY06423.1 hypothetical protein MNVI_17410 [Mycobacterium noviomagense]
MAARQTPATRAKDSDREQTCRALDDALNDGELSKQSDVKSTYLIVEPSRDPTTPDALSLSAFSADYGSGYIAFAGDGTVKQVYYPS